MRPKGIGLRRRFTRWRTARAGRGVARIATLVATLVAAWVGPLNAARGDDHFLFRARAAAEAGELGLALAVVEEGLEGAPDSPHGWLLVARLRGEIGDYRGAVEAYRRAEREVPLIGDCAALGRCELALRSGHYDEATTGYRECLETYPRSPHASRMHLGWGRAAGSAGHAEEARDALGAFLDAPGGRTDEETVEALWLLGTALAELADWPAAREVYERLWLDYPTTLEGRAADDSLKSLERTRGLARTPLSAEQMFERARRLRRGGAFSDAVDELQQILTAYPEHSILPEVLLEEGSIHFAQMKHPKVFETLNLLRKRYPESGATPDGLYLIARAYWRKGLRHHFLSTCDDIRESYPGTQAAENAEFAVGVFHEEQRKLDKARDALRHIVEGPREHSRRRDALWQLGRMDYRDGRFEDAYASFSNLAAEASSGYWKAATYWAGRSLQRIGRVEEARDLLGQLVALCPGHYYGIAAEMRLDDLEPPAGGAKAAAPDAEGAAPDAEGAAPGPGIDFSLPAGWGGDAYVRILLLEEVGFYGLAMWEMRALLQNAPPGARLRYARLAQSAGEYRAATDDIESHFGPLIETLREGLPGEFWEASFPFAYRTDIERSAREFGLDPLLIAAVIREESRFEDDAVSRAGAIGLLQLMPGTARDEARRLGMRIRDLDLYDPATNLRLGIYSLSRRMEQFGGDLVVALAGYNAGDHKARDWRDRFRGLEQDEFVDQMPYLETRLYVKRILASYEHYRRIYSPGTAMR